MAEKRQCVPLRAGGAAARVRAMRRAHAENQAKHPVSARDVIGSAADKALAAKLAGTA